ncbi:hypothetical protein KCU67_g81, partial [Aureobasidium melanogenum]
MLLPARATNSGCRVVEWMPSRQACSSWIDVTPSTCRRSIRYGIDAERYAFEKDRATVFHYIESSLILSLPDYSSGNYDSNIVDGITDEVDKNTHHAEIVSASFCFGDLVTMISMRMLAQKNVSNVMIRMLPVWVGILTLCFSRLSMRSSMVMVVVVIVIVIVLYKLTVEEQNADYVQCESDATNDQDQHWVLDL